MDTLYFLLATSLGHPPATPLHCPAAARGQGDVKGGPPLVHTLRVPAPTADGDPDHHEGGGGLRVPASIARRAVFGSGRVRKARAGSQHLTQPDGPEPLADSRWAIKSRPPARRGQSGNSPSNYGDRSRGDRESSTTGILDGRDAKQVASVTGRMCGKSLMVLKVMTHRWYLQADVGGRAGGKVQEVIVTLLLDAPIGIAMKPSCSRQMIRPTPSASSFARQVRGRGRAARPSYLFRCALRPGRIGTLHAGPAPVRRRETDRGRCC